MRLSRFQISGPDGTLTRGAEFALAVMLTLFAGALRLWDLSGHPSGFHGDEANVTIDAQKIIAEGWIGPWSELSLGYPIAVNYVIAVFIDVLGTSVFSVRLPIALIGTAAIPLAYYVGRNVGGWRVGLCGALLLATSLWHLHLSRMGVPVIAWPTLELATILGLQLGLKNRQWPYFVLTGLGLGVLVWVYPSAFIFVAAVGLYLAGWLAWQIAQARDVRTLRASILLLILAASALFAAKPMIDYYRAPGSRYEERVDGVLLFTGERKRNCEQVAPASRDQICRWAVKDGLFERSGVVWEKSKLLYKSLVTTGAVDRIDGMGTKPPLGRYIAYLAAIGMVVAALRYRRDAALIGFMVVPLLAIATALTLEGQYRRSFGALPFLTLFAGIALGSAWEYAGRARDWRHGAVAALVLLLIAVAGYDQTRFYFQDYDEDSHVTFVFNPAAREAFEYIDSLGSPYVYYYNFRISVAYETQKVLAPDLAGGEDRSLEFTADGDRTAIRLDLAQSQRPIIPARREPDGAVFVFIGEKYFPYLDTVRKRYPGGVVHERYDSELRRGLYRAYYLPADLLDSYLRAEGVDYDVLPAAP